MSLNNARHVVLGSGLPPIAQKTLRFKFHDSFNPITDLTSVPLGSWTQVASNVFDYTYNSTDWTCNNGNDGLFNSMEQTGVNYPMSQHSLEVLDGDLTGVTTVKKLFNSAKQVKRCTVRNTGSVTDFSSMFYHNQMAVEYIAPLDITSATSLANFCDSQCANGLSIVFTRDDSVLAAPCSIQSMFYSSGIDKGANVTSVTFPSTFKADACISAFESCKNLTYISPFDTSACQSFNAMFSGASALESVPAFDTGSGLWFADMFSYMTSLRAVPSNLDTSLALDVKYMLNGCTAVESGALALYTQMSTQATPPSSYTNCFQGCGSGAPSSAPIHAEMQQIPASWGGLGA